MFGSEIAAEWVRGILLSRSPVIAAVGNEIHNVSVVPMKGALPACLHYTESGSYSGPIQGGIEFEELRYVVRFICQGQSTAPILAAATDSLAALNDRSGSVGSYRVHSIAIGEWPQTTVIEEGIMYRQLGTYYRIEVLTMGA